ncbi:MAG: hypothetical protein GY772_11280 [bacterium]|nr:hypothetical protein [bacterium]
MPKREGSRRGPFPRDLSAAGEREDGQCDEPFEQVIQLFISRGSQCPLAVREPLDSPAAQAETAEPSLVLAGNSRGLDSPRFPVAASTAPAIRARGRSPKRAGSFTAVSGPKSRQSLRSRDASQEA